MSLHDMTPRTTSFVTSHLATETTGYNIMCEIFSFFCEFAEFAEFAELSSSSTPSSQQPPPRKQFFSNGLKSLPIVQDKQKET
jgi:hypothetical protein